MSATSTHRSLVVGFLENASRWPERPALVVGEQQLSYCQLSHLSGKIAATLSERKDDSCALAAILASRSVTAYSGILGTLMSGRGYVPLHPKFPMRRTGRMLALSECQQIIVGSECVDLLPQLLSSVNRPVTIILPDVPRKSELNARFTPHQLVFKEDLADPTDFVISPDPSCIAYLLFTSGSTGDPKGVPISHYNARSYITYATNRYGVMETDRVSQTFDLTFDLSVHDMFVCWERGACLFCVPEAYARIPAKFIRDQQLTLWFSVPSVVGILHKLRLLQPNSFPTLRYSLFCGEALPSVYAGIWQEAAPNCVIENLYGPTETTIAVTHYRWDSEQSPKHSRNGIVPIGRVFDGHAVRIVDDELNILSHMVIGELCIAGPQVSQGYWHDIQFTDRKFIRFPDDSARVWYRTGDLVIRDNDGCLHFVGRSDQQIKLHGFRIELQEIEMILKNICSTEQVACVPWPIVDGSVRGIAAFICGNSLTRDCVLTECRKTLPDYMVPSELMFLDELPLNSNGKIDRRGLIHFLEGAERTECRKIS